MIRLETVLLMRCSSSGRLKQNCHCAAARQDRGVHIDRLAASVSLHSAKAMLPLVLGLCGEKLRQRNCAGYCISSYMYLHVFKHSIVFQRHELSLT